MIHTLIHSVTIDALGYAVAQLAEALRYKGSRFDS